MRIIIPLKHLLELMTHDPRLHPLRPPQRPKRLQRHAMPIMPLEDGLKVPALVIDTKVREGILLRIGPEMRIDVDVARAHEVLQQRVQAVADVQLVVAVHALGAVVVVEVPVQMLAEAVEAVDLMEDVDAADVGVRPEAEGCGPFGCLRGVFALVEDVLAGDGDGGLGFDAFPCRVYFWRWGLTEDGFGVLFDECTIESFGG